MKGQRDYRSINSLSTVNEKCHLYFKLHMDVIVWKSTRIAVNRSVRGQEDSTTSAISFAVIRMCDMTKKQPKKFSNRK